MKNTTSLHLLNGKTLTISNRYLRCNKNGIPFTDIADNNEYIGYIIRGVDRAPVVPEPETDKDYHNLCAALVNQAWPTADEMEHQFITSFPKLIAQKELIMSSAEFFLIRIPENLTAGIYDQEGDSFCLGGLLEAWETSDDLKIKTPDGDDAYIFNAAGSRPERNYLIAWVPAKQTFYEGTLGRDWSQKVHKLLEISKRYPWRLHNDLIAIQKLRNARPLHRSALYLQ
ncbi:hypothetical protein [Marinilabilia salmonicolor]|uniref:hypothetical protein n=1 Tax=Marinilabilia salmonicolor TaxID=989 RepID=UPI000DF2B2D7|nr:hypothetical protein [Marinilabilia salmonicolor]